MTTSLYALSRSERTCLIFAVAFLLSGVFYGMLARRVVRAMSGDTLVTILQDCPVLVLISLCFGFLMTACGHYAIRQSLRSQTREENYRV